MAAVPSLFAPSDGVSVVVDRQKGGGRAFVSESVAAQVSGGAFPFALQRFAMGPEFVANQKRLAADGAPAVLSPIFDVKFNGFSAGADRFADDHLQVVAAHHTLDGVTVRHDLWSHAPKRLGSTSPSVLFTAHVDAFAGFEITHTPAVGAVTSGYFSFAGAGNGPQLKPGVYVLAGPSAATGVAPDLAHYAYTGDARHPVRASRVLGLDFAYLSFAVYGEWV